MLLSSWKRKGKEVAVVVLLLAALTWRSGPLFPPAPAGQSRAARILESSLTILQGTPQIL